MMTLRQFLAPLPLPVRLGGQHTTRRDVPASKRPGVYSLISDDMEEVTREVECYPGLAAEKKRTGK